MVFYGRGRLDAGDLRFKQGDGLLVAALGTGAAAETLFGFDDGGLLAGGLDVEATDLGVPVSGALFEYGDGFAVSRRSRDPVVSWPMRPRWRMLSMTARL